jgi:hypothetical protein
MEETIKVISKFIVLYFDSYGTIFDRREVLGPSLREVLESVNSEVDFEYEFSVGRINIECDTLDWLNDDERIIIVGV